MTEEEIRDLSLKERWPLLQRTKPLWLIRTIFLGLCGYMIYNGISAVTNSSGWPLVLLNYRPMSYDDYVKNLEQTRWAFQWIIGPMFLALGSYFGARALWLLSRRRLNTNAEEGEEQNGNNKSED